jgi:hypothetical protein
MRGTAFGDCGLTGFSRSKYNLYFLYNADMLMLSAESLDLRPTGVGIFLPVRSLVVEVIYQRWMDGWGNSETAQDRVGRVCGSHGHFGFPCVRIALVPVEGVHSCSRHSTLIDRSMFV